MSDKKPSDIPKPISDGQRKTKINRRKTAKKSRLANKRKGK
jgi:hypothetical protein